MRFEIPDKVPSASNLREHYMVRAKRVAAQRRKAMLLCPKWDEAPVLVVDFVRWSPRELDDDNLRGALKGYRDGIASRLGIDDGSRLVEWRYFQAKCEKGKERVVVEVHHECSHECCWA